MQLHKLLLLFFAAALATLAFAACGDDDDDDEAATTSPAATSVAATTPASVADEPFFDCTSDYPGTAPNPAAFPVELTDGNGRTVTIDEAPDSIASLSAGHTEVLYAIGAGDQVLAVDNTSNCPVVAQSLSARVDAFNPSVEAITALEPDLVIVFYDPEDLVAGLEAAGLKVLFLLTPESIDGVYDQIGLLGAATGHGDEANELVGDMQSEIDAVVAGLPAGDPPTVFHEVDNTYYSAGSGSFIGDFYDTLGVDNIANATGEPYPLLSAESIVAANPDVIILGDEGFGESADTVAARPGWDAIAAVQNDRVYGIDPDIVSRPGPRVVDAIRQLAELVYGNAG